MYVRMVIGEAISDEQAKEFQRIVSEEDFSGQGYQGIQFLHEDGGNMLIVITSWTTRDDCLQYHSSRAYRRFVAKTQHLLLGNFVVKLFRME